MNTHERLARPRSRQRGITLLEALVALIVLSLGLLGIAKLNAFLVATAGQSKARAEATALAEEKIEDLRNQILETKEYDAVVGVLPTCAGGNQQDSVTGTLAIFTRRWCKTGVTYATQVQVAVSWLDNVGGTQTVTLRSVVAWDSPLKSAAFSKYGSNYSAGQFAKPPTGRAYVGAGTTDKPSDASLDSKFKVAEVKGGDNQYRLVDASGNVLLTATMQNEQLSYIEGYVLIAKEIYEDKKDPVKEADVYVMISDAAVCLKSASDSLDAVVPVKNGNTVTNVTYTPYYHRFAYRCYVGAGWYGNIGLLATKNLQSAVRVCLGDPAVTDTVSDSRKPALLTNRKYRGYHAITGGAQPTYQSVGIGINPTTGDYQRQTYTRHDFLVTTFNTPIPKNTADADALCKPLLIPATNPEFSFSTVIPTDPGNQGKFFCLTGPLGLNVEACPSPLPDVGIESQFISVSGEIIVTGAVVPSLTDIAIDGGSCQILTIGNSTTPYTYSCEVSLLGWAGATWKGNMTLTQTGTLCTTGATGPGVIDSATSTVSFSGIDPKSVVVTQKLTLGGGSSDCPAQ